MTTPTAKKHKVDLTTYPRKGLLEAFKDRQIPFFSTTCHIDITSFLPFIKAHGYRFFITTSYVVSRVVNDIIEFRHRLIDGELYEFERVDPGYTVLLANNTFSFCDAIYFPDFTSYYCDTEQRIEAVKKQPDYATGNKHHMFFITNVPWFSFTAMTHPFHQEYASLPIITLGKYFEQNGTLLIPIGIQVHHGLVDGIHVGWFYKQLQQFFSNPQDLLNP